MTVKKKRAPVGPVFHRVRIDGKAIADAVDGVAEFDAYASVFGNVDSHGDIVHAGAFDRSLKEWAAKGAPIPVHYNHAMFSSDPTDNIGFLRVAQEDGKGLKVTPVLDVGDNEKAAHVYRLLKSGRLRELSIGYMPKTYDYSEIDGMEVRNIRDVDLFEVSVVQMASNDQAQVLEIRSALLYGKPDAKADDADADADADKPADDTDAEPTAEELAAAAEAAHDALEAAAEALALAGEGVTGALAALDAAMGKNSDDEDADATDSEGADADVADAKSRESIMLRTRALLAVTASHGAEGV